MLKPLNKKKIIILVVLVISIIALCGQAFIASSVKADSKAASSSTYKDPNQNKFPVTSVSLSSKTLAMKIGDKVKLTATIKPANTSNKKLIWQSGNLKVATVNLKDGTVTAKGKGTTTITVITSSGAKTAKCTVTVTEPVIAVTSVSLDKPMTLKVKAVKQLTAKVLPANAKDKTVTWTSSNKDIVSVDSKGKVTAKKVGKATITVKTKSGNKTATCVITVTK
jgi:uncharacterized protein YjdB